MILTVNPLERQNRKIRLKTRVVVASCLLLVNMADPACMSATKAVFIVHWSVKMFDKLFGIIEERKRLWLCGTYTSHLVVRGENAIMKKFFEEALEIIIPSRDEGEK